MIISQQKRVQQKLDRINTIQKELIDIANLIKVFSYSGRIVIQTDRGFDEVNDAAQLSKHGEIANNLKVITLQYLEESKTSLNAELFTLLSTPS